MDQDEETTTGFSSAETTENISEVVVDVCANLDIFGQKSGVTRRRKARRSNTQQQQALPDVRNGEGASSPSSAASRCPSQDVDDSPLPIGLGITHTTADGANGSPDQAAMLDTSFSMPTEDSDEADTAEKDFWLDDGIGATPYEREDQPTRDDEVQQGNIFTPHDPEGLSTIFEDEEASFTESATAQYASDHLQDAHDSIPSSEGCDNISNGIGSPSPGTTSELDERSSPDAGLSSADKVEDVEEDRGLSDDVREETMEQSFDFAMDADDGVQRRRSVEQDATPVPNNQHEGSPGKTSTMLPSSVASPRLEKCDREQEQEQEQEELECHASPSEDDISINTSEENFCGTVVVQDFVAQDDGTIVVEDFPTHEDAAAESQAHEEQPADGLECGDAGTTHDSSPLSEVEVASSPAGGIEETEVPSGTPPQATTASVGTHGNIETVLDTPPSKGFTPINTDRVSPPVQASPSVKDLDEEDHDEAYDDLQEEDMALVMDYEPTVPINIEEEPVAATASEPDTEPAAPEEESEAEMLRKFVTRVSANKAAAALAKRNLRPKRRSGSTGSTTTSVTGSPASKPSSSSSSSSLSAESAQRMMAASMASSPAPPPPRRPLGEKDANSPSPTKKRKVSGGGGGKKSAGGKTTHPDDLFSGNPALYSAEISPPKSKRLRGRRRGAEVESDNTVDFTNVNRAYASDQKTQSRDSSSSADPAPRRSTRTRSSRIQLNPPAPSANSIAALSLIPVRLSSGCSSSSSSSSMGLSQADMSAADGDMPTPVVVSRTARSTAAEKDLAAVTRVNTRKNKAGAMPPKVVLGRQAEDPAGFRMRELRGVFDAREGRDGDKEEKGEGEEEKGENDGRKTRKGKGVRWATELVRFNTDLEVGGDSPRVGAVPAGPLVPVRKGAVLPPPPPAAEDVMGVEGTTTTIEQCVSTAAAAAVVGEEGTEGREEKKVPTRRTRQSRLQPPTPVSKKILAGESAAAAAAAPTPKAAATTASVVKMATRRKGFASLGMGVNGTPAPKRRTRA